MYINNTVLAIELDGYDNDELKEIIESAFNYISNHEIKECIVHNGDGLPISYSDIMSIKQGIINNASKIFKISTPYTVTSGYKRVDQIEDVILEHLYKNIMDKVRNKEFLLIQCCSKHELDTYIKDGHDTLIYETDEYNIICPYAPGCYLSLY